MFRTRTWKENKNEGSNQSTEHNYSYTLLLSINVANRCHDRESDKYIREILIRKIRVVYDEASNNPKSLYAIHQTD